jgi:hypothetical protein
VAEVAEHLPGKHKALSSKNKKGWKILDIVSIFRRYNLSQACFKNMYF